jgi:tyrosyl-DNA phosphodiesterase 2
LTSVRLNPQYFGSESSSEVPDQLKVSTWNVWFDKHQREERNRGLMQALETHKPDLMAFQEVTPPFVRALQATEWLKDGYWISAVEHNQIGVVLVGRVPFERVLFQPMPSQMGRRLLVAELVGGVRIGAAHFESNRSSGELRGQQFQKACELLSDAPASLLLGDFNSTPNCPEAASISPNFSDVWSTLKADEPGFTMDTSLNTMAGGRSHSETRIRIDRVLCSGTLVPTDIRLLGTEEIESGLFPSDHFGLLSTFDIGSVTPKVAETSILEGEPQAPRGLWSRLFGK